MTRNNRINRSIPGPRAGRPAFTLVEILVVLVILGIAAAVIVPQLGTRDDLRVDAARRVIMADLIYAQNRAISTQSKHFVTFDAASSPGTYRIVTNMSLGNKLGDAVEHPVTHDSEYKVKFGLGAPANTIGITNGMESVGLAAVSFEGAYNTIAFDELGVPHYYDTATGNIVPTATSGGSYIDVRCGTFVRRVVIEPYTGDIQAPE